MADIAVPGVTLTFISGDLNISKKANFNDLPQES